MVKNTDDIEIIGEPLLDLQVCKFVVNYPILPDGSYNCRNKKMAEGSPLLEALFEIDGITQIHITGNNLTIAKSNSESWPDMGRKIGTVIRHQIKSGKPLLEPDIQQKIPSEEQIREAVEDLFKTEINPSIASHGGRVELANVEGTRVFVRLGGGCQGCAYANVTLKESIEKTIRATIPEVTEVVDVTNHQTGTNPYY